MTILRTIPLLTLLALPARALPPLTTNYLSGTISTNITVGQDNVCYFLNPGCSFVNSNWDAAAFIISGHTNVLIDGGNPRGLILATNNGDMFTGKNTSRGVWMDYNVAYITVQNLVISNMWVRVPGSTNMSPGVAFAADTVGVLAQGSHILVKNCTISGAECAVNYHGWNSSITNRDIVLWGNEFFRNCICVPIATVGNQSNSCLYDVMIVSNRFDHWSEWSATGVGRNTCHLDGIYMYIAAPYRASDSCIVSNLIISHNYFGPDVGDNSVCGNTTDPGGPDFSGTSTIYLSWYTHTLNQPVAFGVKVFNNIFTWTNTCPNIVLWANSYLTANAWGDSVIANNTFSSKAYDHGAPTHYYYGTGTAIGVAYGTVQLFNNFTWEMGTQIKFDPITEQTNFTTQFQSDYNVFGHPFSGMVGNNNDFFGPPLLPPQPYTNQLTVWWTNSGFSVTTLAYDTNYNYFTNSTATAIYDAGSYFVLSNFYAGTYIRQKIDARIFTRPDSELLYAYTFQGTNGAGFYTNASGGIYVSCPTLIQSDVGYAWTNNFGFPWWTTNVFNGKTFDAHSSTNTPLFNQSTWQPLTNDTVLVNAGTNLTSWGIVNDFYGNPRPATGPWTIGAVQTAGAPYVPPVPTNGTVTVTGGTGSGTYLFGATVTISTNAAGFVGWSGDVGYLSSTNTAPISFTMPSNNIAFTANYFTNSTPVTNIVYRARFKGLATP